MWDHKIVLYAEYLFFSIASAVNILEQGPITLPADGLAPLFSVNNQ